MEWRKRIDVSFVIKVNDALCDAMPKNQKSKKSFGLHSRGMLVATQVCDATVAPQNIRFPQDTSLLNEARTKLEKMIDWQQLGYVNRDLRYIDDFIQQGFKLDSKYQDYLETIRKVYEQQKYMLENNTHKVADRIVSISQPYVRPVVRGKVSKPTEFGAKLHLSIDEWGFARIEYLLFDAYNEGPMLIQALEAYKYHHGCYPERVLVDQIYRTRPNIAFCQKNGIRISGPRLGRPAKNEEIRKKDAKIAAQDNVDRIQIERYFSTAKRRNGMGLITKKREDTSLTTIAFSVLVTNIFGSFKLAVEEPEPDSSTTA